MIRHAIVAVGLIGCSSGDPVQADGGPDVADAAADAAPPKPASNIEHLVVIVQENHSFDTYLGRWCKAPSGSNPSCTQGAACCEAGPDTEPSGALPVVLDDTSNGAFDPDHRQLCNLDEINNGAMDRFVSGALCGNPNNFAYASPATVSVYADLATNGAVADRWFQSVPGASSSNNVFFARAAYMFRDNDRQPNAIGNICYLPNYQKGEFPNLTIADLLVEKGISWGYYAEGFQKMAESTVCPNPEPDCPITSKGYPCNYDPGDVPFAFFPSVRDTEAMRDYKRFSEDLTAKTLPSVTFVKAIGFRSEHPGAFITISAGMKFVKGVVDAVAASPLASSTLVLITFDEGGGYFDHVPPPKSAFDMRMYGTRVPTIAVGRFARKGSVSHAVMEHSSVVKFIEWNWLGATGQLGTRDTTTSNIGSLLDPVETGVAVPEN